MRNREFVVIIKNVCRETVIKNVPLLNPMATEGAERKIQLCWMNFKG